MVIGWAAGAGLVLTLIAALAPSAAHTSHSLTGHVTIETSATVVGALVAYLLVGRAQRTGERTDVLLAVSLCVLALSNLMFSLVPAVLNTAPDSFTTWTPFGGRLIAAPGAAPRPTLFSAESAA